MNAPIIRCSRLSKRFETVLAVDSVDLEVWPGEIISILGESGCGKTTLLRLIAGFEAPTAGTIHIQDDVASSVSRSIPPEQRGLGMVVQEYALFPHLTVAANIGFGLQQMNGAARARRVQEVLDIVQLDDYGPRYPYELSGGQQQRVALARTLAPNPITVLLDEPFSNLDSSMRQRLRLEVESILRSQTTAAIFVTHDREEAFAIADRVGVMISGQLHQIDTPERLYHYPSAPDVAQLTGTCDFIPAIVKDSGRIETEFGVLDYISPIGILRPGEPVMVLFHPDDLELKPDRTGQGLVVSREFRGDEVLLRVRLDSGERVRCRHRSFSTLPAGSRVRAVPVRTVPFMAYSGSQGLA